MKKLIACLIALALIPLCLAGCGKNGKSYYGGADDPDPTMDPEQYIPTYEMPYTYEMTYVSSRECEFAFTNLTGKDITLAGTYLLFLADGKSESQQPLEWANQPPELSPIPVAFEETVTLRYEWSEYIPNGALPEGNYSLVLTAEDAEGNTIDITVPLMVMEM